MHLTKFHAVAICYFILFPSGYTSQIQFRGEQSINFLNLNSGGYEDDDISYGVTKRFIGYLWKSVPKCKVYRFKKQKVAGISKFLRDSVDQWAGVYSGTGTCPEAGVLSIEYFRCLPTHRGVSLTLQVRGRWRGYMAIFWTYGGVARLTSALVGGEALWVNHCPQSCMVVMSPILSFLPPCKTISALTHHDTLVGLWTYKDIPWSNYHPSVSTWSGEICLLPNGWTC